MDFQVTDMTEKPQRAKLAVIVVLVLFVGLIGYTFIGQNEILGQAGVFLTQGVAQSCAQDGKFFLADTNNDGQFEAVAKCVGGKKKECENGDCLTVRCGDGVVEGTEQCDGADLGGGACPSGTTGTPGCTATCILDTAAPKCVAVVAEPVCGDGQKNGDDVCDGADLGGQSCATQGFTGGGLGCASDCKKIDVSQCTVEPSKLVISLSSTSAGSFVQKAIMPVNSKTCPQASNGFAQCSLTLPEFAAGEYTLRAAYNSFSAYAFLGNVNCNPQSPFCDAPLSKSDGTIRVSANGVIGQVVAQCGDALKNGAEACDPGWAHIPADIGSAICQEGYRGKPTCTSECTLDYSSCVPSTVAPEFTVSRLNPSTSTYEPFATVPMDSQHCGPKGTSSQYQVCFADISSLSQGQHTLKAEVPSDAGTYYFAEVYSSGGKIASSSSGAPNQVSFTKQAEGGDFTLDLTVGITPRGCGDGIKRYFEHDGIRELEQCDGWDVPGKCSTYLAGTRGKPKCTAQCTIDTFVCTTDWSWPAVVSLRNSAGAYDQIATLPLDLDTCGSIGTYGIRVCSVVVTLPSGINSASIQVTSDPGVFAPIVVYAKAGTRVPTGPQDSYHPGQDGATESSCSAGGSTPPHISQNSCRLNFGTGGDVAIHLMGSFTN